MTATRREQNVQDIPINIASFDGNVLETRAITDLAGLGRNVPGLYVVDQGKRSPNEIVVRGLSLTTIDKPELMGNNGGNVVSTYVGDIPLYVDLALNDMQRVEVLLGPQGTLYGSGRSAARSATCRTGHSSSRPSSTSARALSISRRVVTSATAAA